MRSRILAAAASTLAVALWAGAPAWAQERPVFIPMAAAAKSNSIQLLRERHDGHVANLAMASSALTLFPVTSATLPSVVAFSAPSAAYPGALGGLVQDSFAVRDIAVTADVLPGLQLDVARWQRPAGMTQWDVRSPYAGFAAEGYFVGASVALSESLRLRAGRSISSAAPILEIYSPLPQNLAASLRFGEIATETVTAGLDWNFADWAGIGVTATQSREAGTVLGVSTALGAGASAETQAVGISARVGFGDGWVTTMSFSEGVTQLDLSRSGIVSQFDPVRTQAYGLSIAKHGLFGDDVLGIAVTRPMQLYGTDFAASLTKNTPNVLRPNAAPESDIELGYVTTFLDGALALQANAAYSLNANGDKGQEAVSVLSRAKVRF